MTSSQQILDQAEGILCVLPTWVPRSASIPGRRLKMDPWNLFEFGLDRGGINTRWLPLCFKADNGLKTLIHVVDS